MGNGAQVRTLNSQKGWVLYNGCWGMPPKPPLGRSVQEGPWDPRQPQTIPGNKLTRRKMLWGLVATKEIPLQMCFFLLGGEDGD